MKKQDIEKMTLNEMTDFYTESILQLCTSNELDDTMKKILVRSFMQTLLDKQEMELTGTCEMYIEGWE